MTAEGTRVLRIPIKCHYSAKITQIEFAILVQKVSKVYKQYGPILF